ncbi:MAG TPA: glycosyltransferase family 39 protein, partial [Thermoanaerobaculia bacterium]
MTYGIRAALTIAAAVLLIHVATNHRYGFHRDELQVVDDGRDLAWGYVVYPPLTPAVARVSLELFGPSLVALRFFSAMAMSIVIFLAAMMAREIGGSDRAQILAAAMTAVAPIVLIQGALFQYVAFDFLWWVLIAFFVMRLIRTNDGRWWIPIGATIGIGMMTKSTMAFWVMALVVAVFGSPLRRHLRSRWLWIGVAVSIAIYLPNLVWQIRHDFVSLDFLKRIHARDVAIGRTDGFLIEQLFVPASVFTIPWWIAGLLFLIRSREFRPLAVMWIVTLGVFIAMKGRSYYMGPAYPMLLAAGAVVWERWGRARSVATVSVVLGALMSGALMLPIAPVGSRW